MSNIDELMAKLKAAAQDEIMCREACDTSDLWQDVASPENVLALLDELDKWQQESSAWQAVAEKQLALAADAEKQIAELVAAGIITKVGE